LTNHTTVVNRKTALLATPFVQKNRIGDEFAKRLLKPGKHTIFKDEPVAGRPPRYALNSAKLNQAQSRG
jgi:hypothetical protein